MLQEFVLDSSEFARLICESDILEREPIRFIIIGSREGITEQMLDTPQPEGVGILNSSTDL